MLLMRTQQQPYVGENVLHIAIVRRLDRQVLKLFVESPEGQTLMEEPATGIFFRPPPAPFSGGPRHRAEQQNESDGSVSDRPCCHYGELALAFAACTNQRDTFDYLLDNNAKLHIKTVEDKHNLLHLLVLHSVHKNHQHAEGQEGGGDDGEEKDQSRWCRDMYDYVQEKMEQTVPTRQELDQLAFEGDAPANWYKVLSMATDRDNFTPLTLCAARGSPEMFRHLFAKLMVLQWEFGYVRCHVLPLAGVDQPFASDALVGTGRCKQPTVLQVVANHDRKDLLGQGDLIKVLDQKWESYAKLWFHHRLCRQALFTFLMLFTSFVDMPALDEAREPYRPDDMAGMWLWLWNWLWNDTNTKLLMHVAEVVAPLTLGVVFVREADLVFKYGFEKEMLSGHAFSLLTFPVTLGIMLFRWNRCTCPANQYFHSLWVCHGKHRAFTLLVFIVALVMGLACLAYFRFRSKAEKWCERLHHMPCSLCSSFRAWVLRKCKGKDDAKTPPDHGSSSDQDNDCTECKGNGWLPSILWLVIIFVACCLVADFVRSRNLLPECKRSADDPAMWVVIEKVLLVVQSGLVFGNIFVTLMGISQYGHFVIMLDRYAHFRHLIHTTLCHHAPQVCTL